MNDQHQPQPPTRLPLPPKKSTPLSSSQNAPQNLPAEPAAQAYRPAPATEQQPTTPAVAPQQPSAQQAPQSSQATTPQSPATSTAAPQTQPQSEQSETQEAREELGDAIQESNQVLAQASTAFPLTLFPDTVVVDRAKVTITKRTFFGSAEVMSMRIEDVLNATATVGPVLGSLQLMNRIANAQPYTVAPFWRKDALYLKRVIQGYVIALQKQIDVGSLGTTELAAMLEKLGEDDHPSVATTSQPRT